MLSQDVPSAWWEDQRDEGFQTAGQPAKMFIIFSYIFVCTQKYWWCYQPEIFKFNILQIG